MPIQHRYRLNRLALAMALAAGCADFSLAQESVGDAIPLVKTPEQSLSALATYINDPKTLPHQITKATDGENRTFGDENDLVIVSGRGSLKGMLDGGGGQNFLQLDTARDNTLEQSRRFDGVEVKRSTWVLESIRDFSQGVLVRPKATAINEGHITGGALVQGKLINPGTIDGHVFVEKNGAFSGRGRVGSLEVNGKLFVNELHGAPTIIGDLRLSNSAELIYEVNADRQSDAIAVEGTAMLGEATLNIVATSEKYPLLSEQTLLVADKFEGAFGKIISNLAFLTPTPNYQKQKVSLTFVRNNVPIQELATTDNGRELGKNIEDPNDTPQARPTPESARPISLSPNPSENNDTSAAAPPSTTIAVSPTASPAPIVADTRVLEATDSSVGGADLTKTADTPVSASSTATTTKPIAAAPGTSTPKNAAIAALLGSDKITAAHAIEQLAGSATANLAKATLNSDGPVSASMLSAMRQLDRAYAFGKRNNAPRLASENEENGRVWLQALGHGGTLDRAVDTLQHSTRGLVLGADWSVGEAWRIGVISGKSDTRLDSRGLDGDLDSWHVGAYALRQNGPMSLSLGATYSKHDASTKRRVAFNGFNDRLEGHYDANTQQAFVELGYKFGAANTSIEPFTGLGYQRYQRNSYTEKGGAAALKVHGQTKDNINSTLGVRLAKLNTLDNGMQLTPRLSAGWKHTYGEIANQTRQRIVTGSRDFTVSGASLDRNSLLVDAGLDFGLSATHSLGIGLNGEIGSDSRNHGVTGQWRMSF